MAVNGFGLHNLPYGVFRRLGEQSPASIGVRYEDQVLDLHRAATSGLLETLPPETHEACRAPRLNELMSLPRARRKELRSLLTELISTASAHLVSLAAVKMQLPAEIGDYTDFYASLHHATNVGRLFRPDNPLLPNYKWLPVAYHGRASSVVLSGTPIRRPAGQMKPPDASAPHHGPTRSLDYELEVGFFIGPGNPAGEPVPIDAAEDHLFGFCLVNDWSARDIQSWEYQPLGPFLGKSFATTISPWVVSIEALEPYRAAPASRMPDDPAPLPYLTAANDLTFDVTLEAELSSARMRDEGVAPLRLSRGNLRDLYWTPAQMIAHHTSNGCNLRPGDLLASGTCSGPSPDSLGCLLEITRRGADPLSLPTGEMRRFLEDGDEVTLRAWCEREALPLLSLGECTGRVV
jgi:fumarylacetoacetase